MTSLIADEIVDEDTVVGVDNGNEEDYEDEEELDGRNLEIEVGELQLQVAKLEETLQCYLKDQVHELQQKFESAQVAIYSEHKSLHVHLEHLQSQLGRAVSLSGANIVKNDDTKTCFYTGLPSYKLFYGILEILKPVVSQHTQKSESELINGCFITLIKLRLGVPNDDLAYRFGVTKGHVCNIFHLWINVMSTELKCFIAWPDPETLRENLPEYFKKHYSNTKCITDCLSCLLSVPHPLKLEQQHTAIIRSTTP